MKLIHFILLLLIAGSSFISCEKPPAEEDPRILQEDKDLVLDPGTDLAAICWNFYVYAKQSYLWNDDLPTIKEFDPKQYAQGEGSDLVKLNKLVEKIKIVSKGGDRFSGVVEQTNDPFKLKSKLGFKIESFGMGGFYKPQYIVKYVLENSAADKAGLKRGDRILKYKSGGVLYDPDKDWLEQLQNANHCILQVTHLPPPYEYNNSTWPNQQPSKTIEIQSDAFFTSTICKQIIMAEKKIAYLNFVKFLEEDNEAFSNFFEKTKANDINKLIIDLRNNVGGSMEVVIQLANMIISNNENGKLMLSHKFFSYQNHYPYTTLKNQSWVFQSRFDNRFVNIYFLVSRETASASELLINTLKPYFQKQIVIIGKPTYGKWLGSTTLDLGAYRFYLMSAVATNALGSHPPKQGFDPDVNIGESLGNIIGDDFASKGDKLFQTAIDLMSKNYEGGVIKPDIGNDNHTHQPGGDH